MLEYPGLESEAFIICCDAQRKRNCLLPSANKEKRVSSFLCPQIEPSSDS